jgi:hypothetical protein
MRERERRGVHVDGGAQPRGVAALVTIAAGWLIAAYQLGYGIAAFGAGALEHSISLSVLFAAAAVIAVAMALLATRVVRAEHAAAST